jgi:glycosyltransferase involved in cell wall biosynthesis
MILIDALYINNSGGKILLDYFTSELLKRNTDNFYFVFDNRIKDEYKRLSFKNKVFLKPSLIHRHIFYLKNRHKFSKVFALGNLPPTVKMNCVVITYFQNVILLDQNFLNIKLELKKIIFNLLSYFNYTNYWFVQTSNVKKKLINNNIISDKIKIYPFFEFNESNYNSTKIQGCKFLYVSSGEDYKNHRNLFLAFEIFSKEVRDAELIVTITNKYKDLISLINSYVKSGININNLGYISNRDILLKLSEIDFVIYPSLKESFGLGLIEAAQFNIPIIASDLEYVYDVIEPVDVFNPQSVESILMSFRKYKTFYSKKSTIKINNTLDQIFDELIN